MSAGSNPVVKNLGNRMESLGFCESEDLPAPFPDKRLAQACGQKRDVEQWFGGGLCLCGNIALTISHAVRQKRDSKGPQTQRWGGGQTIAQRRQGELEDGGNGDNGGWRDHSMAFRREYYCT